MKNQSLWQITVLLFCLSTLSVTTLAQQNRPQYANMEARWQWRASTDGITYIPVCWENPQGYSIERQWVKSAVEGSWENAANVNFYGWEQCNSNSRGIRILITDTRSNSYLGSYLDGRPNGMELNFTFRNYGQSCQAANKRESCIKSIAVHEFGHALGLAHEQDRPDSNCSDTRGNSGGWLVTKYDEVSVMNYCNSSWNNSGRLSQKDIEGIQIVYGARTVSSQGQVFVADELGPRQVWENVVMELSNSAGSARQFFHINSSVKEQTRSWNFFGTDTYCYKVWSYAMYDDKQGRYGYGEGCYRLEKGKTYSFALYSNDWNPKGYYNLSVLVKSR